jgi:hypothetical protein
MMNPKEQAVFQCNENQHQEKGFNNTDTVITSGRGGHKLTSEKKKGE